MTHTRNLVSLGGQPARRAHDMGAGCDAIIPAAMAVMCCRLSFAARGRHAHAINIHFIFAIAPPLPRHAGTPHSFLQARYSSSQPHTASPVSRRVAIAFLVIRLHAPRYVVLHYQQCREEMTIPARRAAENA